MFKINIQEGVMKRRILALVLATLMALSLVACGDSQSAKSGSGEQGEQEVYELSLASMYSDPENTPDFNGFGWGIKKFIELVEEESEGRIKITPYWAGVMGGDLELFNQMVDGELDIYYGSPTANIDPIFTAKSIPYLFEDYDQVIELYASEGAPLFELLADRCRELGCEMIACRYGHLPRSDEQQARSSGSL